MKIQTPFDLVDLESIQSDWKHKDRTKKLEDFIKDVLYDIDFIYVDLDTKPKSKLSIIEDNTHKEEEFVKNILQKQLMQKTADQKSQHSDDINSYENPKGMHPPLRPPPSSPPPPLPQPPYGGKHMHARHMKQRPRTRVSNKK